MRRVRAGRSADMCIVSAHYIYSCVGTLVQFTDVPYTIYSHYLVVILYDILNEFCSY